MFYPAWTEELLEVLLYVPKTGVLNEACETPVTEFRQEGYRPIEMLDLLGNVLKFNTYTQSGGIETSVTAFCGRFTYASTSDAFCCVQNRQKEFLRINF